MVTKHELKKERLDVSNDSICGYKSKGPDDERFYVSLPAEFYGEQGMENPSGK